MPDDDDDPSEEEPPAEEQTEEQTERRARAADPAGALARFIRLNPDLLATIAKSTASYDTLLAQIARTAMPKLPAFDFPPQVFAAPPEWR